MNVAIIPARQGSKRIPQKNTREFCGKPMLAWTIQAALESRCFDHILVSTDSDNTATIARQYGAETPFIRPAELSDDHTGTTAVLRHATQWLIDHSFTVHNVCCLYATAPFLSGESIAHGLQALTQPGVDYAFSVSEFSYPVQRALKIENQKTQMMHPEYYNTRSQDLDPAYHDAAQFYWGTVDAWLAEKQILNSASVPIILPAHSVHDIDTTDDWIRAELMFRARLMMQERNAA